MNSSGHIFLFPGTGYNCIRNDIADLQPVFIHKFEFKLEGTGIFGGRCVEFARITYISGCVVGKLSAVMLPNIPITLSLAITCVLA